MIFMISLDFLKPFMMSVEISLQVKIDELVNPRKAIKDYRTDITGISPGDLDGVTCSLVDVQVFEFASYEDGSLLLEHV